MRCSLVVPSLLTSALLGGAPALAAPQSIGEPVVKEALRIAPAYLTGIEMDKMPSGVGMSQDRIHLEAAVYAAAGESHGFAEGAWMPYLDIHYEMTKDGLRTYKKTGILFAMTARDGPHYANDVDMAGPGTYHLSYIVSPPTAHGFLRHTDKASGVPDWWKPILASWTFNYPGQKQMKHLLTAAVLLAATPALADGPIAVTLQNHRFSPGTIHVKANTPAVIALTNKDDAAEEFDSTALKVEKVVAGHSSGNVRLRALAPGRYPFMGEYHAATAQGVVIAE